MQRGNATDRVALACTPDTGVECSNRILYSRQESGERAFLLEVRSKSRAVENGSHLPQSFLVGQTGKVTSKIAKVFGTIRKYLAVAKAPQQIFSDKTQMFLKLDT